MPYRVEVYDQTSLAGNDPTGRLAIIENAYGKSQVKELSNAGSYSFSLPWTDPKRLYIKELNHVKVFKEGVNDPVFDGRILTWEKWMDDSGQFLCSVSCEGFATILRDKIKAGQVEYNNTTPGGLYTSILSSQSAITLGTVERITPLSAKFCYDNLMYCIWKVPSIIGGDIEVDTQRRLNHWAEKGRDLGARIAYGLNMKSMNVKTDSRNLVTRIYGLGSAEGVNQVKISSVNGGVEYLDSDTQGTYGIIESVYVDKEIVDPGTLKLKLGQVIEQNKIPCETYDTTAADLSSLPGYDHLGFDLGDWIIAYNEKLEVDIKLRIVKMTEDHDYEENVNLEFSSKVKDLSDELMKIKSKQNAWDKYPQGAPNLFCVNKEENLDETHPLILRFPIPSLALKTTRVLLSLRGLALQYFSQVAGASSITTSESGGGDTSGTSSITASGGGGYQDGSVLDNNTEGVQWNSEEDLHTDIAFYPSENFLEDGISHNHDLGKTQFNHYHLFGITLSGHTHAMGHTHALPLHVHGMAHTHMTSLDIFEGTFPKNITIKIDGTDRTSILPVRGDGSVAFGFDELDIAPYLSAGTYTHVIEIGSEQLGRIDAWVIPQVYIQSS